MREFAGWRDDQRIGQLQDVEPIHIATYVETLQHRLAAPSVKVHFGGHQDPSTNYLASALAGLDATNINAAMAKLNKIARGNRFAKRALETALRDAQGKRLGVPIAALLGGSVRKALPVLWTLASGDTQRDIEEAESGEAKDAFSPIYFV